MKKRLGLALLIFCTLLISKADFAQESNNKENNDQILFKGFYNNTDVGLLIGSSKNVLKAPFSFMSVTSYHITEQFSAGIGIGADFLEETYVPLVLDMRYYFRNSHFSPYVFIQGGYSIATEKEVDVTSNPIIWDMYPGWIGGYPTSSKPKGGFLLNPGFGIRKMFSNNFGLTFSVSYHFQRLNYKVSDDNRIEVDYNRMNIRMGIIFK